jgi:CHAD domain-containing protein
VGLRGHWKSPIAFYFTKGLQAEVQKELIQHCLEKVQQLGFKVNALTMDGHATNLAMAKMLGCRLCLDDYSFVPSFKMPEADHRTHLYLDTCHMVKLVRNTFEAIGTICTPSGQAVWQLIKDLHRLQDDLGVRLANKLRADHVNFHGQKMKVALAVQTLSASVAVALETLQNLQIAPFTYAGPTVDFLKVPVQLNLNIF